MSAGRVLAVTGLGVGAVVLGAGIAFGPALTATAGPQVPVNAQSCTDPVSAKNATLVNRVFDLTLDDGAVLCVVKEVTGERSVYEMVGNEPGDRLFGVAPTVTDLTHLGLSPTG